MPLQQFAQTIISLSEEYLTTPVLITPRYLSLRMQFFVEFVAAIADQTSRSICIDWYRQAPSPLSLAGDRLARCKARRINRVLCRRMSDSSFAQTVQITASIARPGKDNGDLVVGWCKEPVELPTWTTAIRLGATPEKSLALQSTPSQERNGLPTVAGFPCDDAQHAYEGIEAKCQTPITKSRLSRLGLDGSAPA